MDLQDKIFPVAGVAGGIFQKELKQVMYFISMLIAVSGGSSLQRVQAQQIQKEKYDTNYITDYTHKLGLGIFASQKYASFNMPAAADGHDINYHVNPKLNLGLGGSHKNVSLNLSLGAGYLNSGDRGKTKGLDFQFHFTPYKWQFDLLTSFHKGNYLSPKGYLAPVPDGYYYRPDVKLDLIGAGAYRIANPRKYSPGAALTQNYLQTKSAGSFLYGGEAYYGHLKGDSSVIPANAIGVTKRNSPYTISFINAGPGIGYGYTLVIAKHYFIAASVIGNADLNIVTEEANNGSTTKTNIGFSGVYKGAVGYNSATWSVAATAAGYLISSNAISSSKNYLYNTGHIRLAIARKINL